MARLGVDRDRGLDWTADGARRRRVLRALRTRFDPRTAVVGTFGLFLGSFTWPYATSLFAHAGTIGLLSHRAVGRARRPALDAITSPASPRAFAVASEYPGVYSVRRPRSVSRMHQPARACGDSGLGTIPAALLILTNNYLTTGNPLSVSYGANANFPKSRPRNAMGFSLPGPKSWCAVVERVSRLVSVVPGHAAVAVGRR
jgi:hypothetical protein